MATNLDNRSGRRGNPWRPVIWGTAACLLLLPAVAMRFTAEVDWSAFDFIAMGALLFGACAAYEVAAWLSRNTAYRAGAGIAIGCGFLLVWVNLAVGIIGSEDNPANLVYAGVLVVAFVGAALGRFTAHGMERAMYAAAIAQTLAAAVALALGEFRGSVLSGFFVALWLTAAALFRKGAQSRT
ncbi:MAG TPA: hypothetical protein VEY50_11590 [Lysobacter sp.]|nr:hypothetical protein [Lysobacter sp.]